MSQIITTVCDGNIHAGGEPPAAETYQVSVQGPTVAGWVSARVVEVDLCHSCAKPLAVLAEELAEAGRQVAKSAQGGGLCPLCSKTMTNGDSLRSHVRRSHGLSLKDARAKAAAQRGESRPTGDASQDPNRRRGDRGGSYVCPVGCGRDFDTPQGVSMHFRRAHPDQWATRKTGAS